MPKILITGTAGFIGFHLVEKMMEEGWDIIGLDNINDYYDINLKYDRLRKSGICKDQIEYNRLVTSEKYNNYRFIKLNLEDKENILNLFDEEKFSHVVNLAAQAGVRYSLENPHTYINSNIYGFLNILEGCRHNPVKHLYFASSSSVYGLNNKIPFSENDIVDNPISLYAASKKSNELMAHTYSHLFNIPTTGFRFFTVYGPWGRPDMAYFSFVDKIYKDKEIPIFSDVNSARDYTYIDDVIQIMQKIFQDDGLTNESSYSIYNIGNSNPVQLSEFIHNLEEIFCKKIKKKLFPKQPGDVEVTYADTTLLLKKYNIIPKTEIKKGLHNFVNWFKEYYHV
jgi:UDP-glucuronate 4-epimerase